MVKIVHQRTWNIRSAGNAKFMITKPQEIFKEIWSNIEDYDKSTTEILDKHGLRLDMLPKVLLGDSKESDSKIGRRRGLDHLLVRVI